MVRLVFMLNSVFCRYLRLVFKVVFVLCVCVSFSVELSLFMVL